jgi:hypothetical protein
VWIKVQNQISVQLQREDPLDSHKALGVIPVSNAMTIWPACHHAQESNEGSQGKQDPLPARARRGCRSERARIPRLNLVRPAGAKRVTTGCIASQGRTTARPA